MGNKLVLIFNEADEILEIPQVLIFNNEKDASEFFYERGHRLALDITYNMFSVNVGEHNAWTARGKAYWGKHV